MEYSRAKATDGRGWVYGYPVVVPTLPYPPEAPADDPQASPEPVMIGLMFPTDVSKYNGVRDWSEATTSVDINTIQRHIGVIGGNLADVFEGDIITANRYPFENWNAVLTWNNDFSTFVLKYYRKKGYAGRDIFADMVEPIKYLVSAKVDVIGNTVDDGNLL